ncbi:hypothetical protein LPJ73_009149, partial [Coemansia sp. RSA 2703]
MSEALPYFASLGFPSTHSNPANFFIDLTTIDFSSDKAMQESEQHVQALADSFAKFRDGGGQLLVSHSSESPASIVTAQSNSNIAASSYSGSEVHNDITQEEADLVLLEPPPVNSWFNEFSVLLQRDWTLVRRKTSVLAGLAATSITTIIFLGFVFFQLKHDQASVQNRIGALFMFSLLCSYPIIFPVITMIMMGRGMLMRERSAGMYRMTAFFFAKTLSFYPLAIIPYTLAYIGVYFIAHFQYTAAKFFIGLANTYVLLFTAIGFAFGIAMIVSRIEVALIIAP